MENNDQIEDLHFDISARVIRQLGEELVTDEITAIMELVKNAYDADADWVKISIHTDPTDTRIEIEDNGFGMNLETIKNAWLFISMSSKNSFKESRMLTPKGRAPLGDKGLGRLSLQKLGYEVFLKTGKAEELIWHEVMINWEEFNDVLGLSSIPLKYGRGEKKLGEYGTTLKIRKLRNASIWEKKAIDTFRGQLSQLIFPFKEKRPFNVNLRIDDIQLDLDEVTENLRKAAIGRFTFSFDREKLSISGKIRLIKLWANDSESYLRLIQPDSGKHFFKFLTSKEENREHYLSNLSNENLEDGWLASFNNTYEWNALPGKEDIVDHINQQKTPANPGMFSGEIDEHYLQRTEEYLSKIANFDEYKTLVKNQIGVRVFRDGFGIKPYGFNQNDWLGLSKAQTSGGSIYNLRPQNVIGYVLISTYENIQLKEKTDREGFIDSPYTRNFYKLMDRVVDDINFIYEKIRRSYNKFRELNPSESKENPSIKETEKRLKDVAKLAANIEKPASDLSQEFENTNIQIAEKTNFIKNDPLFTSESERLIFPLLMQIEGLMKRASVLLKDINEVLPLAKELQSDANYLLPKIENLEDQLDQFAELAGLGLTAEALTHELLNIIDRISAQTDNISSRLKNMKDVDTAFYVYIEQVKTFVKNIRIQVNHLAPSLKYNREQKQEINLEIFVNDLKTYFKNRFAAQGIEFAVESTQNFSIRMNVGKLTQVFDNLILNSEYWLREKAKTDVAFKPKITIEIEDPLVRIFDNGNGISPEIEGTVFQPFVTKKPRGVGRGLGLFITQQILESQGGEIYLLLQRNDAGRRYIFQMNLDSIKK